MGRLQPSGESGVLRLDVFRWDRTRLDREVRLQQPGIQGLGGSLRSTLDGQWIDITGLPDGNYTIELEANPQGIIQESDIRTTSHVPISIGNPKPRVEHKLRQRQTLLGRLRQCARHNPERHQTDGRTQSRRQQRRPFSLVSVDSSQHKPVTVTLSKQFQHLAGVFTRE